MRCRVCQHEGGHTRYTVREMMFGWRDEFQYFQCPVCRCLQIEQVPDNLSKYYPDNYYSFDKDKQQGSRGRWRTKRRDAYALTGRGILGRWFHRKHPAHKLLSLRRVAMTSGTSICDVGCGAGALLDSLAQLGFTNLCGVDPFIDHDLERDNGVEIRKASLHELDGPFDLIMFHHAFEHVTDPAETLRAVRERLTEQGTCVIRIPVVPSHAWERYGVNWVQLDAPRHLFLHSVDSMTHMAGEAGLRIKDVVYDSTRFQFLGSERYMNDIPLKPSDPATRRRARALFTHRQRSRFATEATELNRARRGDQAAFYLRAARRNAI